MSNAKKQENGFLNLLISGIIPIVILMKFSDETALGPIYGLLVALAFPLVYGLYEFILQKKYNFVSIIGFISVLLTGGIALLKLETEWIAVKEAAIPLVIGIGLFIFERTNKLKPIRLILEKIIDFEKVAVAARHQHKEKKIEKAYSVTVMMITGAFFVSAALNYILAKILIKSPSGTSAFNEELGKMTGLSFLVISLPVTLLFVGAVYYFFAQVKKATKRDVKEFLKNP